MTDKNGKEIKSKVNIVNENLVILTTDSDYNEVNVLITGEREKQDNFWKIALEQTARVLMGVKSVNITYNESNGTILPGYLPRTQFIGMSKYDHKWAPGLGFVFGTQDVNFGRRAADEYGWITRDSILNMPYQMTNSKTLNIRVTVEPVKNMRLELSANRTQSSNFSEYYHYNSNIGHFESSNKLYTGSFSMTYNTWRTTFVKFGDQYYSTIFDNFINYRKTIADRLAAERLKSPDAAQNNYTGAINPSTGFPDGYGPSSQEVIIPAFLAAYSGHNPAGISLSAFPGLTSMSPNWTLNFTGLTNIKKIKEYFQSITISHSYRSTYSVSSFSTNLDYNEVNGISWVRYNLGNFIPKYEINVISISEQLSPLIGVDATMKNSLIAKVEIKRSRNLSLNLSNTQLNEMQQKELVVGSGYRIKDIAFKINNKPFKSDLNIRANLTIRSMATILRKIDQNNRQVNQITSGNGALDVDISADYQLGANFMATFFIKHNVKAPKVSTTFKTSLTEVGFSVKFTLSQL